MVKDSTNRDGRRVRAGAKLDPLNEKFAKGAPATRLEDLLNDPFDILGADVGDSVMLFGETMPEPSDYLSAEHRQSTNRSSWVTLVMSGRVRVGAPQLVQRHLTVPLFVIPLRFNPGLAQVGHCLLLGFLPIPQAKQSS